MKHHPLYTLALIVAFGLILRIFVVCTLQLQYDMRSPDSHEYLALAESLVHKGAFSHEGRPETLRTPGYPFFLVLCNLVGFETNVEVAMVQAGLSSLKIGLIVWLIFRLYSYPAAVTAGIILALNPSDLHLTAKILSESLFSFLLVLAFFCLIRKPFGSNTNDGMAGVLIGLAALTRPIAMWLFLHVMLFRYIIAPSRKAGSRALILLLLGVLFTQGIWVMRNHKVYGEFYFSEITAASLYVYCSQAAIAFANNQKVEPFIQQGWQEWEQARKKMKPPQMINHFTQKAMKTISKYPFSTFWLVANGAYRQVVESGFTQFSQRYITSQSLTTQHLFNTIQSPSSFGNLTFAAAILLFRILETMAMGLLFLFAGFQIARHARLNPSTNIQSHAVLLAALITAYLFLLSCTPAANIRFREQYFPFLVFLTSPVMADALSWFWSRTSLSFMRKRN